MEFCLYSEDENINEIFYTQDFRSAMEMASKDYEIKIYSQEDFVRLVNYALAIYFQIEDNDSFPIVIPQEVLTSNKNNQ
jgi:hypothetical protein